ncbi:MAG: protein kinase [Planctomycetes bacterium]|nr:protein kinase [Planctomycetota bacterium]
MAAPERYELLDELGRGGTAVVYRARDRMLGREVAIKFLRHEEGVRPEVMARLKREAQAIAALEHPHLVRVYDVLEDGLVMELVPGRPLDLPSLPLPERLRALEDVAGAIHVAHERGIVHRDLKPGNVLREAGGRVVVTDFGLAHVEGGRSRLTRSGMTVGTPLYMAPEQIRGQRIDRRADVYSLGVMLYEALAGDVPFRAPTVARLYQMVLTEEPPPLKRAPRALATICLRALAKEPADRYGTAGEMAADLACVREGRSISTRAVSSWMLLRRRKTAIAVGVAILLAVVTAVGSAMKLRRSREGLTHSQRVLLEGMRKMSGTCLQAALDLRRVGRVERMREYASKVNATCGDVIRELPGSAEPHYLKGRMHRALLEDGEALAEQERALRKEPGYAPALYERIVLTARLYRRRLEDLEDLEGRGRPAIENDARARGLMQRMREDLDRLKGATGDLSEGQQACAEGLRAWAADRCDEVRRTLQEVVATTPHLEEAYEALAAHERLHGAFEDAIKWWTEGLKRDRGYVVHLEGRSLVRRQWGVRKAGQGEDPCALYEEAIRDLDDALRLYPERDQTWWWRGATRTDLGTYKASRGENADAIYEAAIEDFGEAMRLNPTEDDAWVSRGTTRLNWAMSKADRGGDPTELYRAAMEDFEAALKLNAALSLTWAERGRARMNRANYEAARGQNTGMSYERAIEDYGEALRLNPRRGETWMLRGTAFANWANTKLVQGEDPGVLYEKAIEDYGEALRLNPGRDETWLRRGIARMYGGVCKAGRDEDPADSYEAAERDFGEALRLNPGRDETWMSRGLLRGNWGDYKTGHGENPVASFEAAIEDLGKACALNPSRCETWHFLGSTHLNLGRYWEWMGRSAVSHYQSALEAYGQAVSVNPLMEPKLRPLMEDCRRRTASVPGE